MLEVEGLVHSRSGGRRQLIWHPGRRDEGEPPRLAELQRYSWLRQLLRRRDRWHSTDWLIVTAEFDPDLVLRSADEDEPRSRLSRDLPVNFFRDHGKSARAELEDGPRPVSELRAAALGLGISITTLERAKKQLGARSVKLDLDRWGWELSETERSEDEVAAA